MVEGAAQSNVHAREAEVTLVRSLSGLLLKWREIVKIAQRHPLLAEQFFRISSKDDTLHHHHHHHHTSSSWRASPVERETTNNTKRDDNMNNTNTTSTSTGTTTINSTSVNRRGASSTVKSSKNTALGGEKDESCVPLKSSNMASRHVEEEEERKEEVRLQKLVPPIEWIHHLPARQSIIPLDGSSPEAQMRSNRSCDVEEILDETLIGEIVESTRVAFAGMNALQSAMLQREEETVVGSVKEGDLQNSTTKTIATIAISKGNSTEKVMGSLTSLEDFQLFCVREHRYIGETMLEFHESLLKRMMYNMKEVLHELHLMKRGLRDSVELCAIHKKRICLLSSELHVEENRRAASRGQSCLSTRTPNNTQNVVHISTGTGDEGNTEGNRNNMRNSDTSHGHLSIGSDPNIRPIYNDIHGNEDVVMGTVSRNSSPSGLPPSFIPTLPLYATHQHQKSDCEMMEGRYTALSVEQESPEWHYLPQQVSPSSSVVQPQQQHHHHQLLLRAPEKFVYTIPRFGFTAVALEGTLRPHVNLHVTHVESDSPAQKAGLAAGDVVVELKGVADALLSVADWEKFLTQLKERMQPSLSVKVAIDGSTGPTVNVTMRVASVEEKKKEREEKKNKKKKASNNDKNMQQQHRLPSTSDSSVNGNRRTPLNNNNNNNNSNKNKKKNKRRGPMSTPSSVPSVALPSTSVSQKSLPVRSASSVLKTASTSTSTSTTTPKAAGKQRVRVIRVTGKVVQWNPQKTPLVGEGCVASLTGAKNSSAVAAAIPSRPPPSPPRGVC
ncbi:hypothetical protein LSM04_007939 [Trypanosoma melophagium]|uniref:uncharacterized protein n=1 Tax=Trypanosoma melophagium TaxID=715481 RepID=UPI00351A2691|nr:hypothetical protein LSM04_007939 [Trypanosoma melophagium]